MAKLQTCIAGELLFAEAVQLPNIVAVQLAELDILETDTGDAQQAWLTFDAEWRPPPNDTNVVEGEMAVAKPSAAHLLGCGGTPSWLPGECPIAARPMISTFSALCTPIAP